MARTIQSALKQMIEENVNMPSDRVTKARASRDWLLERIENFEKNTQHLYFCKNFKLTGIPIIYPGIMVRAQSFSTSLLNSFM